MKDALAEIESVMKKNSGQMKIEPKVVENQQTDLQMKLKMKMQRMSIGLIRMVERECKDLL